MTDPDYSSSSSDEDTSPPSPLNAAEENVTHDPRNGSGSDGANSDSSQSDEEETDGSKTQDSDEEEADTSKTRESNEESDEENYNSASSQTPDEPETKSAYKNSDTKMTIKKNMNIDFFDTNTEEWKKGTIVSRAGKASGKYKSHWNVNDRGNIITLDLSQTEWKVRDVSLSARISDNQDEVNLSETYIVETEKSVSDAKEKELQNWKIEQVYEEVDDVGQDYVSVRWVITKKLVDNQYVTKARLVARGFQECVDDLRVDSPTCMRESLKVLMCLAISKGYILNSIDIKAAFLQGKNIDRVVFLKPPPEANAQGKVWKLNKAVYGLSDASRVWYLRVVDELTNLSVEISKHDKALFIWRVQGVVEGYMAVHVDDFLWCGSKQFETKVIEKMKSIFKISKENSVAFKYLGLNVKQSDNALLLSQNSYVETIQPIQPLAPSLDGNDVLDRNLHSGFRGIVGQISWACGMSRPDVAFDCCVLSTAQSKPTIKDLKEANKSVRDMKSNNFDLRFPALHIPSIHLAVYSDASFGNLKDGSSQGGYIIFLADQNRNCAPVSWSSKKLKRVVRSTLAAETLAAMDALDSAFLIARILSELLSEEKNREIRVYTDNKSLHDVTRTSHLVEDKRLRIEVSALREMLEKDNVSLHWVNSDAQLADALTKKGAPKNKLIGVLKSGRLDG